MPTFNESEVDRLPHPSQPHHDVDERTPLLPNTSSYTSNPVAEPGNGKKALTDEQGRKRKLVGITVSLVLGTFCAGLGEFGSFSHGTVLISLGQMAPLWLLYRRQLQPASSLYICWPGSLRPI